jgi:hypothetical protein
MSSSTILETVVYRIKSDLPPPPNARINEILAQFPGFLSRETYPSTSDPQLRIDYVKWESLAQAQAAMQAAQTMPALAPFFGALEEVVFLDHFLLPAH